MGRRLKAEETALLPVSLHNLPQETRLRNCSFSSSTENSPQWLPSGAHFGQLLHPELLGGLLFLLTFVTHVELRVVKFFQVGEATETIWSSEEGE